MNILMAILNFLSGGVLSQYLGYLQSKERMRLEAMNETQRLQHEETLAEGRNRVAVRKATAGFWEMRLLTFAIAFPFVFHLWSIWLDTQFKLGWKVDKFPSPFDEWEGAILLSFFGITVVGVGLKAIAGAVAYRNR